MDRGLVAVFCVFVVGVVALGLLATAPPSVPSAPPEVATPVPLPSPAALHVTTPAPPIRVVADPEPPAAAAPPVPTRDERALAELAASAGPPLGGEQKRRLREIWAEKRQAVDAALSAAHLDRAGMSADERTLACAQALAALDAYRDGLLAAASDILDAEQLSSFRAFITAELERERDALKLAMSAE